MDYIGSKEKLNEWMFSIMMDGIGDPSTLTFMDACAGSGSVSKYAVQRGFGRVISNDLMKFSQHIVIGATSLTRDQCLMAHGLIVQMNNLKGIKGFFYRNYSEHSGRLYFSDDNAKKIDAMRQFIDTVDNSLMKSYLLYCLLEAVSAVSNTAGVQAAFLKALKDRACKDIVLRPFSCLYMNDVVKTFNQDILSLLTNSTFRDAYQETILYIDPPYNERQYGPNYHIYETLVRYDDPVISGKTGLRDWKNESRSPFCSVKTCLDFTKQIINATRADNIYISYSSDGLLSVDDFRSAFSNMIIFEKEQRRYKADTSTERTYNTADLKEYLFNIKK